MEPADRPSPAPEGPASKRRSAAGLAAGAGLQFAISIVVFLFVGQWLDRRLDTAPVFLFGCVFLGAGGSFYAMYRQLTAAQRREDEQRAAERAARAGRGGAPGPG